MRHLSIEDIAQVITEDPDIINEVNWRNLAALGAAGIGMMTGGGGVQAGEPTSASARLNKILKPLQELEDQREYGNKIYKTLRDNHLQNALTDLQMSVDELKPILRDNANTAAKLLQDWSNSYSSHYPNEMTWRSKFSQEPLVKLIFQIHPEFQDTFEHSSGAEWTTKLAGTVADKAKEADRRYKAEQFKASMRATLRAGQEREAANKTTPPK